MKFTIEMDTLEIDPRAFAESVFQDVAKKAMFEVLADHGLKMDRKQKPDGSGQTKNSPGYAKKKSTTGIYVKGRYQRGEIPTILTGQMKASRQVVTVGREIQGRFDSEGAVKARSLVDKGYGIHYFSKQNIEAVQGMFETALGVQAAKAIKVRRRT